MRFTKGLSMRPLSLDTHQQVFASFGIYAFAMGNIFPRLPDIKAALDVGEGALGLALIGAPVGTLISLTLGAPLLKRVGHRQAMLALIPLVAIFYAIAVQATGTLGLFLLLIPPGLMIGAIEILVNVEADRTEAAIGRRIMNRSHAFWSLGFFAAGMFGAVMAQLGISPQVHLMLVVVVTCIAVWLCLSDFQPAPARGTDTSEKTPRFSMPTLPIMILVSISFSAMLLEGASIDWSAIYMVSVFQSAPFMGGLAVASAAACQGVVRYFADGFVDRYSPVLVARVSLITMALGVVFVFFAGNQAMGLLGFALIGAGTSVLFPLTMSAAAQRTDRPATVNVAALAQFSFMAFLVGPPLLGFVAEYIGLRWAFGVGLPLVALSYAVSGALGDRPET